MSITPAYETVLEGGKHWSFTLRAGMRMRMSDIAEGANVGMLLYNPQNTLERYNAPDTLKCQHTFKLTRGHCLYSDMGRIFASIIEDEVGWHDTVCGSSTAASVARRWGEHRYQAVRNDWLQNGHDAFLVEGAKYGLGRRDLVANVNFFSKVVAAEDGALALVAGRSAANASVTLRFEMDTLILLHTCPHPLDRSTEYPRKPVAFTFDVAAPVAKDDLCRTSRPENARGFQNTELYNLCAQAEPGARR